MRSPDRGVPEAGANRAASAPERCQPARAFVGGQGLDALDEGTSRTDGYRRLLTAVADGETFAPGSQEAQFAAWIAATGADPWAVRAVLDTMVATLAQALREVPVPTLIVVGDADSRGASAGELAALLPNGRLSRVPGDHLTAFDAPEFTSAVLEFLS